MSYKLICGDMRQIMYDFEPESVDAIITDPPYPKENMALFEALAIMANRVLKPDGSLFVMVPTTYLPDIMALMTPHINYYWTLPILTGNKAPRAPIFQKRVLSFWKPVLWFRKNKYTGPQVSDIIRARVSSKDKEFHKWGQNLTTMADIVIRFTKPGDIILDPFNGSGTTGLAAERYEREYIGIDNSEKAITDSLARHESEVGLDKFKVNS